MFGTLKAGQATFLTTLLASGLVHETTAEERRQFVAEFGDNMRERYGTTQGEDETADEYLARMASEQGNDTPETSTDTRFKLPMIVFHMADRENSPRVPAGFGEAMFLASLGRPQRAADLIGEVLTQWLDGRPVIQ